MTQPRVYRLEPGVWVLEWPPFGFTREPDLIAYGSWSEAACAAVQPRPAAGSGGRADFAAPVHLYAESDRWSLG